MAPAIGTQLEKREGEKGSHQSEALARARKEGGMN
jgi:hypothetical protein